MQIMQDGVLTLTPPVFFTSAAYIQVPFRLDFFMEANNMKPDQTAPLGAA